MGENVQPANDERADPPAPRTVPWEAATVLIAVLSLLASVGSVYFSSTIAEAQTEIARDQTRIAQGQAAQAVADSERARLPKVSLYSDHDDNDLNRPAYQFVVENRGLTSLWEASLTLFREDPGSSPFDRANVLMQFDLLQIPPCQKIIVQLAGTGGRFSLRKPHSLTFIDVSDQRWELTRDTTFHKIAYGAGPSVEDGLTEETKIDYAEVDACG